MIILGTNSIKDTGYDVDNSVRLDGTSAYLTRTPSSAGNRQKWTWSGWVKRSSNFAAQQTLFGVSASSSTYHLLYFSGNDTITHNYQGTYIETNAKYRDPSAWFHIVLAVDTTQGTNTNRLKLYVNGTQVTSFSASGYPSQNTEMNINNTVQHDVANSGASYNHYINGYMAEVCFINNQQLDPTSFGEFDEDSGIWKPIDVSGLTFGTNVFYLDFENSGSLGADVSGNGNNFTVNNLTAIDQSTDTCTNNFCTLNPLNNRATLSEGNLQMFTGGSDKFGASSTFQLSQGKWYCELKYVDDEDGKEAMFGITSDASENNRTNNDYVSAFAYGYYTDNGSIYNNNGATSYGSTVNVGDIVGIAFDLDNNKLYFSINGTFQNSGNPATNTNGFSITASSSTPNGGYTVYGGDISTVSSKQQTLSFNFGSPPYTISSGNTDADGYGNFEYAVPNGYFSLNSKNLAEYG